MKKLENIKIYNKYLKKNFCLFTANINNKDIL